MNKWVILDRDGTIIEDKDYLCDPEQVSFEPCAAEGLLLLQNAGCRFVIASNQSGINRGYFTKEQSDAVFAKTLEMLAEKGIKIEAVSVCPHRPDENCRCRKPKPGLIRQVQPLFGFSDEDILCVIGDKKSDVELAENLGTKSVLVMTGKGRSEYEKGVRGGINAENLFAAAMQLLKEKDK